MLQLGLLKVVTWPGSRFKETKDRSSKFVCTHPTLRDVLQSYAQLAMRLVSKRIWELWLDIYDGSKTKGLSAKAVILLFCSIFLLSKVHSNLFRLCYP